MVLSACNTYFMIKNQEQTQCILLQRWSLLLEHSNYTVSWPGHQTGSQKAAFSPCVCCGITGKGLVCYGMQSKRRTKYTQHIRFQSISQGLPLEGKEKRRCDLCPVDTHGVIGGNSYVSNKYVTEQNDSNAAFVATSFSCPLDSKHFIPGIVPVP